MCSYMGKDLLKLTAELKKLSLLRTVAISELQSIDDQYRAVRKKSEKKKEVIKEVLLLKLDITNATQR